MTLFFIIENNQPHSSGGGYYSIFKLAEFLAIRNHKVYIYSVHDLGWVKKNNYLNIYFRPSISRKNRLLKKLDKMLSVFFDIFILGILIKKVSPDWILGVFKESAIKAVKFSKVLNIPVVNFIYECPPWVEKVFGEDCFKIDNNGYTKKLWDKTRKAYLETDILFPNSNLSKQYNSSWLGSKNIEDPIYPGVDSKQMSITASSCKKFGEPKRILYIGRLVETKNVDKLIAAYLMLNINVHLHICGEGPEKKRLKAMITHTKPVFFHGYISDKELWFQFNNCDLVVFPSSFEGFGMPPMQALYFCKPCLVSDIPVFKDIYKDFLYYFPLNNVEQLCFMMEKLLTGKLNSLKDPKKGREFVLNKFSWSKSAEKVEKRLLEYRF